MYITIHSLSIHTVILMVHCLHVNTGQIHVHVSAQYLQPYVIALHMVVDTGICNCLTYASNLQPYVIALHMVVD